MNIANAVTMRIKCLLVITGALILLLLIATMAFADSRVLDEAAWHTHISGDFRALSEVASGFGPQTPSGTVNPPSL
jgi:hypothetical protein